MPKDTFFKLKEDKKRKLTEAFLREFSLKSYDEASITSVVKELGIAKGSVYQYFNDKLDLFMYLVGESSKVKQQYVAEIKREDFDDYWAFFRKLFSEGVKFDLENPLESHFLHNLPNNLNSPSIKQIYDQFLNQITSAFESMVQYEIDKGYFRDDLPVKTMAFFLYKSSLLIMEQMELFEGLSPAKSIINKEPVYKGKVDALMKTVDNYIIILKKSFDKIN
ncbi:MAG: hypothetical protein CMO01_06790 [Thalassobius sp.]|nr:hypothetical protein [Thalassovita sp.]